MNATRLSQILSVSVAVWIGFTSPTLGAVYQSSVRVDPVNMFGANYVIGASTEPAFSGNVAPLYLSVDTHLVLRPVTSLAGGLGHIWFETLDGRIINPSFITNSTPFANPFTGDFSGQIQMTLRGSFLLAFWLDANFDSTPNLGDRFGWARLRYTTANGLTLADNAIEDTGAGIIAGTTNVVPEPSSSLLLVLSLGLSLPRRASRQRRAT